MNEGDLKKLRDDLKDSETHEAFPKDQFDFMSRAQSVKLIGNYHCRLTEVERNRWEQHVRGLPIWEELCQVETDFQSVVIKMQAAVLAGNMDAVNSLDARYRELKKEQEDLDLRFFELAKSWHAEVIKLRTPVEHCVESSS